MLTIYSYTVVYCNNIVFFYSYFSLLLTCVILFVCFSILLSVTCFCILVMKVIMPPPRGHNAVIGVRRPSVRPPVCPSDVAYIGSNSKTKRPRKTKLCTFLWPEVYNILQVSCDSHTDFKVKRSKVKVTGRRHIVASTKRTAIWRTAADITSLKYYLILQCL